MGQASSKKPHVSAQPSATVNSITDTNYSLTFTGHVVLNTPRKSKNISYKSICEEIMGNVCWYTIIKESMRDSILSILQKKMGEEFYSSEYPPVSDIVFIIDKRAGNYQKYISGTVYWKSILTDPQELAESIAMNIMNDPYKTVIRDSRMNWAYHFIPGKLVV